MAEKNARRRKGEGSIGRHHNHPTCPPVIDGVRAEHKCKGLWRARVTVTVQGRKTTKVLYGKSEPEITAKKKALLVKESQGRVALTSGRLTVAEWIEEWYQQNKPTWAVNTWQVYRSRLDCWIVPQLGHLRLDRVTEEDVEALYNHMRSKGRAEGTIQQIHAVLSKSFTAARKAKLIPFNPMIDVQAPGQKVRNPRRPLTVEEARLVLKVSGDDPRPAIALMTGMRQGEVLALRWCDVKLDGTAAHPYPHIRVERSRTTQDHVGFVYHGPKSDAGKRVVPLVLDLPDRLKKHKARAMQDGLLSDEAIVFQSGQRRPISTTQDRARWYAWLDKAGVERTPLHAARNTVAALLEDAHVPDRVVSVLLGHADVTMTHRYQHGNVRAVTAAMAALEDHVKKSSKKKKKKHGKKRANKRSAA